MPTPRRAASEARTDAGCWSAGLFAIAIFFALGALISLMNGDLSTALEASVVAGVAGAAAAWLRRRARSL